MLSSSSYLIPKEGDSNFFLNIPSPSPSSPSSSPSPSPSPSAASCSSPPLKLCDYFNPLLTLYQMPSLAYYGPDYPQASLLAVIRSTPSSHHPLVPPSLLRAMKRTLLRMGAGKNEGNHKHSLDGHSSSSSSSLYDSAPLVPSSSLLSLLGSFSFFFSISDLSELFPSRGSSPNLLLHAWRFPSVSPGRRFSDTVPCAIFTRAPSAAAGVRQKEGGGAVGVNANTLESVTVSVHPSGKDPYSICCSPNNCRLTVGTGDGSEGKSEEKKGEKKEGKKYERKEEGMEGEKKKKKASGPHFIPPNYPRIGFFWSAAVSINDEGSMIAINGEEECKQSGGKGGKGKKKGEGKTNKKQNDKEEEEPKHEEKETKSNNNGSDDSKFEQQMSKLSVSSPSSSSSSAAVDDEMLSSVSLKHLKAVITLHFVVLHRSESTLLTSLCTRSKNMQELIEAISKEYGEDYGAVKDLRGTFNYHP